MIWGKDAEVQGLPGCFIRFISAQVLWRKQSLKMLKELFEYF
jgi:hypothetical protein